MKMILGAFLLSCFLFTPPSVLAEVNSEEERIKQTVDQFLSWYAKSEPEILHRRLLSKVRAPAISEAARFRAMFHVLECEVVLADAFLTIAEYFDGENPLIDQTRQEKQAFLTKRSRKLQAEAFQVEGEALKMETNSTPFNGLALSSLLNLNQSRLLYQDAFECDPSNFTAFVGYERTAARQYSERYKPGDLLQKSASP